MKKRRRRVGLLAVALWALSFGRTGQAAGPYDPSVPYRTLHTEHFRIMFPKGYRHLAYRTADIAEQARPYLNRRYRWTPAEKVNIILNDQTDYANGSATIVPSKVVTIYLTAPTRVSGLEDYDNWLTTVVIHELAHIWHLDMAYGLPWLGRWIFGKYIPLNQYNAAWSTEGLAVYEETVSTGAGRGRSSYVDMIIRTAALADRFPSIDQGYRGFPQWPFSNVAYFFGGRFHVWLANRFGEDRMLHYHRRYAATPIPYITYIPAKLTFNESIESLWQTWGQAMRQRAEEQVQALQHSPLAVTVPTRLSAHGGQSLGPRVTPDGQYIVFSTSSPYDGPRVRRMRIDGKDETVLVNDALSEAISFTADGDAFYFKQTGINERFYSQDDILRYDLRRQRFDAIRLDPNEAGDWRAPSGSLRARDPDVSPDGKRIVFVQNLKGENRLVLAWLESDGLTIHPKTIVPPQPDVQLAAPRFSPTDEHIVVSRFASGRRDIVLYDFAGRLIRTITRDRAQDIDPTWTPDGRYIVFSSDRTGIYNLYAYRVADDRLWQLTNLTTGAFQPSLTPDGRSVIFRGYSADGFDVYKTAFAPLHGLEHPLERAPAVALDTSIRQPPARHSDAPRLRVHSSTIAPPGAIETEYAALDTILPFRDNWNLYPSLLTNERETRLGFSHFAVDARRTHSYGLFVDYGLSTRAPGGALSYALDTMDPTFRLSGAAETVSFGRAVFVDTPAGACPFGDDPLEADNGGRFCFGTRDGYYDERRFAGQLSVSLPIRQRHSISLSYRYQYRSALHSLPAGTVTSALPRGGRFARVRLGYAYANVRSFPYSVSLERGPSFSIALDGLSRGLGSDYEQAVLSSEGRYYVSMPWRPRALRNHVWASRLALGAGFGPDLAERFRLGGVAGSGPISTTTTDFYMLRGLAGAVLSGTALVSLSTEYRAPLFRIDRGFGTAPFVARVVHAAVFADAGRVFEKLDRKSLSTRPWGEVAMSVGAELRGDILIFYGLPLRLRLGVAWVAKMPDSLAGLAVRDPFYFRLGSTF